MSFCSSTLMTFSRITLLKVAHSGDLCFIEGTGEKVDIRTTQWPVRLKLHAELEACPLPVYIGQCFIDPKMC